MNGRLGQARWRTHARKPGRIGRPKSSRQDESGREDKIGMPQPERCPREAF